MHQLSRGKDCWRVCSIRALLLITMTALSSVAVADSKEDAGSSPPKDATKAPASQNKSPSNKPLADSGEYPPRETMEASVLRGDIAFHNYCVLCHGANADGRGRAARLYNPKPANLRQSMVPDSYKEAIIRKGGKAMGRSEFMPPWGEELTDEQIGDLVNYLRTIAPPNAQK